jgi:ribosomal protein S18 acetylase RimI-like enzyme
MTQSMNDCVAVRPVREADVDSLCAAVNSVCAERRYLATEHGFTVNQTHDFVMRILLESLIQFVAIDSGKVVGWCDILPSDTEEFAHVGRLGMGVISNHRGYGIGRRLLSECLHAARTRAIEKIELEVYSDNQAAICLYDTAGFKKEGLRKRVRKLGNAYQDSVLMGLLFAPNDR